MAVKGMYQVLQGESHPHVHVNPNYELHKSQGLHIQIVYHLRTHSHPQAIMVANQPDLHVYEPTQAQ